MTGLIFYIGSLFFALILTMAKSPFNDFTEKLPATIESYTLTADTIYRPQNLHEYINGGAELYISFGFKHVLSYAYSSKTEPEVYLDIFDMGTSTNAYGIFSHSREKIEQEYGRGSQYSVGSLTFWKDRFYISISSMDETEEVKKVIFQLAETIDNHIREDGDLPRLLLLLPHEGLIEESVKYFYHHIWLNSHYFISSDNVFLLDSNSQAVLAKYLDHESRNLLLIVQYSDATHAGLAKDSFIQHILDGSNDQNPQKMDKDKWIGWHQDGSILAIVFDAETQDSCKDLISGVKINLQKFLVEDHQ